LIGRKKAQKAQKIRINVLCFLCLFVAVWLLEFDLFSFIMRHFATQKLATGVSDSESKGCLRTQFSTHKLPEVSEAR